MEYHVRLERMRMSAAQRNRVAAWTFLCALVIVPADLASFVSRLTGPQLGNAPTSVPFSP